MDTKIWGNISDSQKNGGHHHGITYPAPMLDYRDKFNIQIRDKKMLSHRESDRKIACITKSFK